MIYMGFVGAHYIRFGAKLGSYSLVECMWYSWLVTAGVTISLFIIFHLIFFITFYVDSLIKRTKEINPTLDLMFEKFNDIMDKYTGKLMFLIFIISLIYFLLFKWTFNIF